MPYDVRKRGDFWETFNTETGEVKGKHKTRDMAVKQLRLLYFVKHGGELTKQ